VGVLVVGRCVVGFLFGFLLFFVGGLVVRDYCVF